MAVIRRREVVAQTLFDRVVGQCKANGLTLVTSSRKLVSFANVDAAQMPALYQTQKPETQERSTLGLPAKRTMHFELWLYVSDAQEDSVVPATQLNDTVDAIEMAIAPDAVTQASTLGGLVASARIDGSVEMYENATADGKSIAVVPIAVLLP